jgi:hypothetical protein
MLTVKINCASCRRCKSVTSRSAESTCAFRTDSSFNPLTSDRPCENWLPSKSDLKLYLLRERQTMPTQEELLSV